MSNHFEAISQLTHVYSTHVDERDFERLGALLAEATFSLLWTSQKIDTGEIRGREEIESFYRDYLADKPPTRHVITNLIVEADEGGGRASARSYLTAIRYRPGEAGVILSGRYEDEFELVDGAWRFRRKGVIMELPA